jgi:hypothetical protein
LPAFVKSTAGVINDNPVTVNADVAVKTASVNVNRSPTAIHGNIKIAVPTTINPTNPSTNRNDTVIP